MKKTNQHIRAYFQCIPFMLGYQAISSLFLVLVLTFLRWLSQVLIYTTGRPAITNSNISKVLFTWQGAVLVLVGLVSLFIIFSININGLFILANQALKQEKINLLIVLKDAVLSIGRFMRRGGFVYCLYLAVTIPLIGVGIFLPQTASFQLPNFVASAIYGDHIYMACYAIGMLLLAWYGFRHLFMLPYVLIENRPIKEAGKLGLEMLHKNWKHFILRVLLMILEVAIVVAIGIIGFTFLPTRIEPVLGLSRVANRFIMLFISCFSVLVMVLLTVNLLPIQILELTRLFYYYRDGHYVPIPVLERKWSYTKRAALAIILVLGISSVSAGLCTAFFDTLFPRESKVQLISHRLGGYAKAENSIAGLRDAMTWGVYGYETDVQRDADGDYIINHDSTFNRMCGESRRVSELTTAEIKNLRLINPDGTSNAPPTLKEVLQTAKGCGHVFIELKGATADDKMCDDVVSMVREMDMVDQCTIISLQYDVVSYVDKKYDDIETGYLYFFSYGNTAALNCDMLIMEEGMASDSAINAIHAVGKKAGVWTVNEWDAAARFLDSNIDYVITDRVPMCKAVKQTLKNRSDYQRVLDAIRLLVI